MRLLKKLRSMFSPSSSAEPNIRKKKSGNKGDRTIESKFSTSSRSPPVGKNRDWMAKIDERQVKTTEEPRVVAAGIPSSSRPARPHVSSSAKKSHSKMGNDQSSIENDAHESLQRRSSSSSASKTLPRPSAQSTTEADHCSPMPENDTSAGSFWSGIWAQGSDSPAQPSSTSATKRQTTAEANAWAIVPIVDGSVSGGIQDDVVGMQSEGSLLGGLFSTRRPKDASAGLASGLKSVGKGVAAGAASLVVCPIIGATQEGFGGFVKGMGAGMLAAVALPLTGLGIASYQVVRGVANTPEAVLEKSQGRKWDKKKREWKDNWYSLTEEASAVSAMGKSHVEGGDSQADNSKAEDEATKNEKRTVVDTAFYDALEVPTNASQEEIRKQYYKLARKCHPDKNPDDPESKIKFQKLGEAYQVLGDEERRQKYDEFGASAANDMPIIDSSLFFMMLFGSDELEPYIGKLKMAQLVESMDKEKPEKQEDSCELEQLRREVQLALSLRDRLKPLTDASGPAAEAAWREEMKEEGKNLCQSSFGDAIVEAIGWTYENYAAQFLGKLDTFLGLGGRYAKMQAQSRSMGNSWKTASSAIRAALATRQLQQREMKKLKKKEKAKKKSMRCGLKKGGEQSKEKADSDETKTEKGETKTEKGETKTGKGETKTEEESKTEKGESEKDGSTNQNASNDSGENDQEKEKDPGGSDGPTADDVKQLEETLPLILETMLNICLIDIESTVRSCCKKVLKDMSASIDLRRRRAEGMMELGKIFQEAAEAHKKSHKEEKIDARKQMEEAFIRAAQKADGDRQKREGESPTSGATPWAAPCEPTEQPTAAGFDGPNGFSSPKSFI